MKINNYLIYIFLTLFIIDMILTSIGLLNGYQDANYLYDFAKLKFNLIFNFIVHVLIALIIYFFYLISEKILLKYKKSYFLIMITIISFYFLIMLHNLKVLGLI